MFTNKTIFIIGAGASAEAGLPTGEKLKPQLAKYLNFRFDSMGRALEAGDHQVLHALKQYAKENQIHDINPLIHKARQIASAMPPLAISIDNFLDAHRADKIMGLCGKLGIARSILEAERQSLLRAQVGQDDFDMSRLTGTWYARFFQMLTESISRGDASTIFDNVSIVSFNYDRCIERFLLQALREYYQLSPQEAEAIMKKLKIWHPYGTVGNLPWQGANAVSYGADRTGDLLQMSGRIKTFTESCDQNLMAENLQTIEAAETIVFLGFAFHPMNMRILTSGKETRVRRIFATTYGLSPSDVKVVQADILKMTGKFGDYSRETVQTEFAASECQVFFQTHFRSLSSTPY